MSSFVASCPEPGLWEVERPLGRGNARIVDVLRGLRARGQLLEKRATLAVSARRSAVVILLGPFDSERSVQIVYRMIVAVKCAPQDTMVKDENHPALMARRSESTTRMNVSAQRDRRREEAGKLE